MYLADLMEKSEAGQFIVLSYLQQHSTSSLKAVMSETGFSKATLTKYISLINDKAMEHETALSIQLQDEALSLSIGPDTKGRDIRRLFLDNAVKYQILNYLLYHQQFLAHQLAQELMISEATLGRHIAGLNQILSEFELSIQNAALKVLSTRFAIFISASFARSGPAKIGKKNFKNQKEGRKLLS